MAGGGGGGGTAEGEGGVHNPGTVRATAKKTKVRKVYHQSLIRVGALTSFSSGRGGGAGGCFLWGLCVLFEKHALSTVSH